jgi:periplasmic protein TonB
MRPFDWRIQLLAPQSSDSRHEFVGERSEILSDATDLDELLAALLDDQAAPTAIKPWRRAPVETPPVETQREPTPVAPPVVDLSTDPEPLISPVSEDVEEDDETDAIAQFEAESDEKTFDATVETGTLVVLPAAPVVSAVPSSGRADIAPQPGKVPKPVKPLLLLTGLVVAALAIGAVYVRTERNDMTVADRSDVVAAPSQGTTAPTPVPAAAPVEPPATMSTPAVINEAPPRRPMANPRATTRPPRQLAGVRANTVRPEVAPSKTSSAASVAPPVAVPQPVADRPGSENAAVPAAIPNAEPPKPTPTAPAALPVPAPTAASRPVEPVTTPTSPVVPPPANKATPARLVTGGPPEYPADMRTARIGGTVEVRFTIDSRGRVGNVRSVTGPPQLRSVAEAAVRRWRYEPAQRGTVAIESEASVNFNFDPSIRRPQQ